MIQKCWPQPKNGNALSSLVILNHLLTWSLWPCFLQRFGEWYHCTVTYRHYCAGLYIARYENDISYHTWHIMYFVCCSLASLRYHGETSPTQPPNVTLPNLKRKIPRAKANIGSFVVRISIMALQLSERVIVASASDKVERGQLVLLTGMWVKAFMFGVKSMIDIFVFHVCISKGGNGRGCDYHQNLLENRSVPVFEGNYLYTMRLCGQQCWQLTKAVPFSDAYWKDTTLFKPR